MTRNASAQLRAPCIVSLFTAANLTATHATALAPVTHRSGKVQRIALHGGRSSINKFAVPRTACLLLAFCVVTAMTSVAQGFTVLHSFAGYPTDGAWPHTGLVQASNGTLYGTTASGGEGTCTYGCGTIYDLTPPGSPSTLFSFNSSTGGPTSALIQATDGNFYGTSYATVFDITASGIMTPVYSFCSLPNCADGSYPASGVIQAANGNFYGSTYDGGAISNCDEGCGTVFELTPDGTLTTLHSFNGPDGIGPGVLIQASDGNFYGITLYGGTGTAYGLDGNGAFFQITPEGTLTTLYNFCSQPNCSDGGAPTALIQASDGNFYGTTLYGGVNGQGTVFEITAEGTPTTVYSFCALRNCADGSEPTGVMQANDGNLYGTTLHGGGYSAGTVFEITAGTLTTIHTFGPVGTSHTDGADPFAGLIQAADGTFYGTTLYGGSISCPEGCGTVFSFGPATSTLSHSSFNFGHEALNETSAAKTVTLENSGMALLTFSSITISGNFAISVNTCAGAALTQDKGCKVSVTFTPTVLGLQTGTLTFVDNARNSPQTVALSGTGIVPAALTPTSATYGAQSVGTTIPAKTFTLTNNQTVALTGIAISTTGDFAVSTTTCTTSLAAKGKCTISVTFTPTQTGTRTGQLSVSDGASNSPQTSALKGTGK